MLILPLLIKVIFPGQYRLLLHIFIMGAFWSIVAAGWDLIMGYAGILSFGQIAFLTVGAYATGLVSSVLGFSPWLGIFVGGIAGGVSAFLIGLPCLRLSGIYVALVTFAFHEALRDLLRTLKVFGVGGGGTLPGIPSISIAGYTFSKATNRLPWYYLSMLLAFSSIVIIGAIIRSSLGSSFVALRDSKRFAKSLGVNEYKAKLIVFSVVGLLTGTTGAFYAHYMQVASVRTLGIDNFVFLLVVIVVGGLGRYPGAVVATFLLAILNEYLRPLQVWRPIIFGGLATVIIIFAPEGIMGFIDLLKNALKKLGYSRT